MMAPRRPWLALVLLILAAAAVVLLSPLVGYAPVDYAQAFRTDVPRADNPDALIFFDLRLGRALFAALVGGALALSGAVFQVALRNELATPYTLGVSGGASLGALLVLRAGGLGALVAAGGVAGGALSVLLVLLIARRLQGREGTVTLLLAGVTLNLLFGALILVLQYLSDPFQAFHILRWLMGGVDVVGLGISAGLVVPLGAVALWILAQAHTMNLLGLDDLSARSLGIDPDRARLRLVVGAAVLAALVVSFAGPVGFVGLVVPQALRRLLGDDQRFLLPASIAAGGAFLAAADTLGRLVGGSVEVPVGIVTALIGGPAFLWLLLRRG